MRLWVYFNSGRVVSYRANDKEHIQLMFMNQTFWETPTGNLNFKHVESIAFEEEGES